MMWLIVKEIKKERLNFVFHLVFIKYIKLIQRVNLDWIQGSNNSHGIRAQDLQQLWDQGWRFKAKMWIQSGKIYLVDTTLRSPQEMKKSCSVLLEEW